MNSASWWSKKLGPTPQQPTAYPPSAPPPPPRLPSMPQPTAQSAPNIAVTQDNIGEVAMLWQGGEATRRETGRCPQCGSDLYFSRTNTGGIASSAGMSTPAPRCYECGYTEGRQMQGLPPA